MLPKGEVQNTSPAKQEVSQEKEDKHFMSAAHRLLKEKVSEDTHLNMLEFSEGRIKDKDIMQTQGTFDLNGQTTKFWATFKYSTEEPLRLKVGPDVIFDITK